MKFFFGIIVCVLEIVHWRSIEATEKLEWPYVKPRYKKNTVQSPIDVPTALAKYLVLEPIEFHNFMSTDNEPVIVENTGYYLEVKLDPETKSKNKPWVTGGPLFKDKYLFQQLHFHWGRHNECGSENYLDKNCFSMEVHIVFYKKEYKSYDNAIKYPDGLAVVGFFGQESLFENHDFDELINIIPNIIPSEKETKGSFQNEFKFLKGLFQQKMYYAFPGSLTTPDYEQCVTWILYKHPFPISSTQIHAFHQLHAKEGGHLINQNDRKIQKFMKRPLIQPFINGRPKMIND
ncbi:hypothetical protein PGB90_003615 [Kerria lacca]